MTIKLDVNGLSLAELVKYPPSVNKATHLAHEGLWADSRKKQWFFERILEALDVDLNELRAAYEKSEYGAWEPGIAP